MFLRSLALAGAAIVAAVPAYAAYTTGIVNIRTGPGTNYPVITAAAAGAHVSLGNCVGSWCRVNYGGVQGWMSSLYIAGNGPRYVERAPTIYDDGPPPPPVFYPRYRSYDYGPSFSFSIGNGNPYRRHHRW